GEGVTGGAAAVFEQEFDRLELLGYNTGWTLASSGVGSIYPSPSSSLASPSRSSRFRGRRSPRSSFRNPHSAFRNPHFPKGVPMSIAMPQHESSSPAPKKRRFVMTEKRLAANRRNARKST